MIGTITLVDPIAADCAIQINFTQQTTAISNRNKNIPKLQNFIRFSFPTKSTPSYQCQYIKAKQILYKHTRSHVVSTHVNDRFLIMVIYKYLSLKLIDEC